MASNTEDWNLKGCSLHTILHQNTNLRHVCRSRIGYSRCLKAQIEIKCFCPFSDKYKLSLWLQLICIQCALGSICIPHHPLAYHPIQICVPWKNMLSSFPRNPSFKIEFQSQFPFFILSAFNTVSSSHTSSPIPLGQRPGTSSIRLSLCDEWLRNDLSRVNRQLGCLYSGMRLTLPYMVTRSPRYDISLHNATYYWSCEGMKSWDSERGWNPRNCLGGNGNGFDIVIIGKYTAVTRTVNRILIHTCGSASSLVNRGCEKNITWNRNSAKTNPRCLAST